MDIHMKLSTLRSPWRAAFVAVAAFALLAPHAPASGGDGDEDGVFPKHGGDSEQQTAPGTVGLAAVAGGAGLAATCLGAGANPGNPASSPTWISGATPGPRMLP